MTAVCGNCAHYSRRGENSSIRLGAPPQEDNTGRYGRRNSLGLRCEALIGDICGLGRGANVAAADDGHLVVG
jgi:hypothetical protein